MEVESLLISWAVPKGPSLDPQVKRLAVHVEDHPLDYSNFEGKIPEGEYGAGNVIVWDTGTWELLTSHDFQYDMKKGKLTFMLIGKKLHGVWSLIRLKNQRKNWLLFKHQDKYAISGTKGEITAYKTKSVLSNKEIKLSHGEK